MFLPSSASRMLALFEPLSLDGGGVGERVRNKTCGVFAADPLSRRAARAAVPGHPWPPRHLGSCPADLCHKGRGMQLVLEANWVRA